MATKKVQDIRLGKTILVQAKEIEKLKKEKQLLAQLKVLAALKDSEYETRQQIRAYKQNLQFKENFKLTKDQNNKIKKSNRPAVPWWCKSARRKSR